MQLHVKAKQIAFLGVLAAICVLLVYGGTVLAWNTLFLLCAASLCLGVAIKECGIRLGFGFFLCVTILSFFLTPEKMHCVTLFFLNLFVFLKELLESKWNRKFRYFSIIVFNVIYIPVLVFAPRLIYTGKISTPLLIGLWIGGQIGFLLYVRVYNSALNHFWINFRKNLSF